MLWLWFENVPKVHALEAWSSGPAMLRGGGSFKRWSLMEGN
jgi:hypothetical protein